MKSISHDDYQEVEIGKIEQFFGGPWNYWVHKLRFIIVFVCAGWTGFAIFKAKDIGPLTAQEEFLPKDNPITIVMNTLNDKFKGTSQANVIKVEIFWGVKDLNKDGVGSWDSEVFGTAVMDDKFDISSKEAQQSLLNFCSDLKDQKFILDRGVDCWFERFTDWLKTTHGQYLPIEPADFKTKFNEYAISDRGRMD